ncbi:hypothetical protein Ahy_Scaffold1g107328 isoform B [Arachis hypogaea]|uniref:Disease resistance N-terminal domain-containing protein n=1 Tax=Arachis hypogaea TaxID=3818 RepID=A0A444WVG7_ARAHY|nr:hypothetical protein Ahy_Scaffold1g107328 isoform B [Arachis hypogaea]
MEPIFAHVIAMFCNIKNFTLWTRRPATETMNKKQGQNEKLYHLADMTDIHDIIGYGSAHIWSSILLNNAKASPTYHILPLNKPTDALLGIVIGNLNTCVKNEIAALSGVDSQIQELSDNLEAIRALFQDAAEEQFTSHAMKDWLKKLSDAAHVLEDILEDCSMESNRLQRRQLVIVHTLCIWSANTQHEELAEMGKKIVKNCVGSPLAARVLGSLLRNEKDEKQWLDVLKKTSLHFFSLKLRLQRRHECMQITLEEESSFPVLSRFPACLTFHIQVRIFEENPFELRLLGV